MFCLAKQSKNLIESRHLMKTGIKLLLSTKAHPESNTTLKDPVRQVFISQSNDVFTNLALEDWLYKNHDFDHKVRLFFVFLIFLKKRADSERNLAIFTFFGLLLLS